MSRSVVRFLASQAMLCLVSFLALVGLLLVGLGHLLPGTHPRTAPGAIAAACPPVLVSFADDLQLGKLEGALAGFKARIVAGPDPHGAFLLSVPAGQGQAVVDALNARPDLVVVASLREPCLPER